MGANSSKAARKLNKTAPQLSHSHKLNIPAERLRGVDTSRAEPAGEKDGRDPQEFNFHQALNSLGVVNTAAKEHNKFISTAQNDKLVLTLEKMRARTAEDLQNWQRKEHKILFAPQTIVAIVKDLQANESKESIIANYQLSPEILEKLVGLEAPKSTGVGQRRRAPANTSQEKRRK